VFLNDREIVGVDLATITLELVEHARCKATDEPRIEVVIQPKVIRWTIPSIRA
jgi:hypothetical protein